MYYMSFTLEHWGKYMDYTWTVSTPAAPQPASRWVWVLPHADFLFVCLFFFVLSVVGVKFHLRASTPWRREQKKKKKRRLGSPPSLAVSLVSLIVDLADDGRTGGLLSPPLRCIVVEATQVFQSGLVAELVLVLRGRNPTTALLK